MSRLAEIQARFQQKQMQEKEEKLLRLYENQQQRAFEKVSRGSSGNSSVSGGTSPVGMTGTTPGRVRQMFDERRQKAGIDRSYPLEPLKQTTRLNGHVTATRVSSLDRSNAVTKGTTRQTTVKSTVQRTVSHGYGSTPLKSSTIKGTAQATYTNGRLVQGNKVYEETDDVDNAVHVMRQQQTELEELMNNHNINESLEDEELPDVGIDEVDDIRMTSPQPNENENYINKKSLSNGSYTSPSHLNLSTKKTTTTKASPSTIPKEKPTIRKEVSKVTTPTKSSQTRPNSLEKNTNMKPAYSTPKAVASKAAALNAKTTPRSRMAMQSAVVRDDLLPCKFCQRRFASDRLEKHEDICSKTMKKKRKTYDAVKHRVQGTEAEMYVKKGNKTQAAKAPSKKPEPPKSNWRSRHEEFIATVRAAKIAQAHVAAGGKLTDLPPPPPSSNPDYVQCPHCGRRFNEAAAARHIPKCATMLHNKPKPAVQSKRRF